MLIALRMVAEPFGGCYSGAWEVPLSPSLKQVRSTMGVLLRDLANTRLRVASCGAGEVSPGPTRLVTRMCPLGVEGILCSELANSGYVNALDDDMFGWQVHVVLGCGHW